MTRGATISAYPGKCVIRRAVEHARELGLDVAAIEVAPGGVIRILTPAAFAAAPKDEYTRLVTDCEKFRDQVRDTCARAEKAESQLAGRDAENKLLREVLRIIQIKAKRIREAGK